MYVDIEFAKMALHRHPGPASGYCHFLVVIAHAAARGKSVAQPKIVLLGNSVGDIGKSGRALIGSYHQVGIDVVFGHHQRGPNNTIFCTVVGEIQQSADKQLIASYAFLLRLVPGHRRINLLGNESTLRAHGHNNGILHLLGFYQAQYFGSIILLPVRPSKASPGNLATAQVNALNPG